MKKANLLRLLLILCGTFSCCNARKRLPRAQSDYDDATDTDEDLTPKPGGLGKYFVYVNCTTCKIKSELVVKSCESETCENEDEPLLPMKNKPTVYTEDDYTEPSRTTEDDISECILDCIVICITNCIKFRTTRYTRPGIHQSTTTVTNTRTRPGCPPPRPPEVGREIKWPSMESSPEDSPCEYLTPAVPPDYEMYTEPPDYYEISSEQSDYYIASESPDCETASDSPDCETASEPQDYDETIHTHKEPLISWKHDTMPEDFCGGNCVTEDIDIEAIIDKQTWFVTEVFTECCITEAEPERGDGVY